MRKEPSEGHMRHFLLFVILIASIVTLAGCELAGDIFQAGVWVGALLVVGIIALIIWMVSKVGS
jgi:uncharacterized membrane protein YkvI